MNLHPNPTVIASHADGDPGELTELAPLCAVFRRFLKSQQLKYTPERAEILNAIIERDETFEADALLQHMRRRGYRGSKATVYRTIRLLQDAGIITPVLGDSKQSHYRVMYGRQQRDVIICVKTGCEIEFSIPELSALRERICRQHGWEAIGHQFQIFAVSPSTEA